MMIIKSGKPCGREQCHRMRTHSVLSLRRSKEKRGNNVCVCICKHGKKEQGRRTQTRDVPIETKISRRRRRFIVEILIAIRSSLSRFVSFAKNLQKKTWRGAEIIEGGIDCLQSPDI